MTKIVVLDGYTTNPGDLSWQPFQALGEFTSYDRTPADLILDRIGDADIVLTNKTPLSAETIDKLPGLTYIGAMSTGHNVINSAYARSKGIVVTYVPEYATYATAQMTIALLLELTNRVGSHSLLVHDGAWQKSVHFCFTDGPMKELFGKTLGLIGYGRIARRTAVIASALGMQVVATSRSIEAKLRNESTTGTRDMSNNDIQFVSMDTLLSVSDVISCHCPLTPETERMICKDTIERMKDGVLLINTSRGPVLHEKDVADALNAGKIAGAAVDVLSVEPPSEDNPLLYARNCIITPHIAWAPLETRARLLQTVYDNLISFLSGTPQNLIL